MSVETESQPTVEYVNEVLGKIEKCLPTFHELLGTTWNCSKCKEDVNLTDNYCIDLGEESDSRCIESLLTDKTSQSYITHCFSSHKPNGKDVVLNIHENVYVCRWNAQEKCSF